MRTFACASITALVAATLGTRGALQDEAQGSTKRQSTIELFRALQPAERSAISRGLQRRLQRDNDPDVQRLFDFELRFDKLPIQAAASPHDSALWAKRVAPARRLLSEDAPAWKAARARFPATRSPSDLQRHVDYAWGRGEVVRSNAQRIDDDAIFENLANGYAPLSQDAYVSILAILDAPKLEADEKAKPADIAALEASIKTRRAVASWAEHLYADLDARAFAGITLWDAWHAHDDLDVPDVDAIPFAAKVLGETWKSPIPANAARTALYERIRKAMQRYRRERELREVAAATWLTVSPRVGPELGRLVVRMHQLWAACEDDPARMADRLARVTDRDRLLEELDRAAGRDAAVYEAREDRRRRMARLAAKLRNMARDAILER